MVVFGVWFVDGCTRLHMENYLSVDFVFLIVVGWLFILVRGSFSRWTIPMLIFSESGMG